MQLRRRRRLRAHDRRRIEGHAHGGIGERGSEQVLYILRRVSGKHPALDGRARALREGILGVAAGNQRRDAGGAQLGVEAHVLTQPLRRSEVGRRLRDGMHVRRSRTLLQRGKRIEARASGGGERHRKLEGLQAAQGRRQPVDRVVRAGKRAMSARTRGLEREGHIGLLAGSHFEELALAVLRVAAAAVEIDDHGRVDQLAMLA